MIEHLATAGTLNAPRKHRFSEQFNDDILNMVASLTDDVTKHYRKVTNLHFVCNDCYVKKGKFIKALRCFFLYTVAVFIAPDLGG
jgi:hypothetical protein